MIHHISLLLRKLFEKNQNLGLKTGQIGFEPPDENWRKYVSGLQQRAINIYLVDLRENYSLRSNETLREFRNGVICEMPAPRWVDCHYLITAWEPAAPVIAHGVEPALAEQAILSVVVSFLLELETESLTPRQVYAPDPLPADFPRVLADAVLPVCVLPGEGFPKLAEFWGSMGAGYRWKPAVYLIVTLPVIRLEGSAGMPVTTLVTGYGQVPGKGKEAHIQISGSVLDTQHPLSGNTPAPVAGAVVRLKSASGELLQETLTNESGAFIFSGLSEGNYQLHVSAAGKGEKTCLIGVCAGSQGTGILNYDVFF